MQSTRGAARFRKTLHAAATVGLLAVGCASTPPTSSTVPTGPPAAASVSVSSPGPTLLVEPSGSPAPDPYAGIAIDKIDAKIIQLTREPGYLGVSSEFVWAPTPGGLHRIDPKTLAVQVVDKTRGFGLAATRAAVWGTDGDAGTVSRLDPTSNRTTVVIELIGLPNAVSILGDSVWVAQHQRGTVTRLREPSGSIVSQVELGPAGRSGPQGVTATKTGVWIGIPNIGSVVRVDPASNTVVATIKTETSPCGGIAVQADAVWVSSCYDDHFAVRIDPRTNTNVAEIDIGGNNGGAVIIDGAPWFPVANRLVRIDPATNRIDRVVEFAPDGFLGFGSAIGFDAVWIGGLEPGQVARIPLTSLE